MQSSKTVDIVIVIHLHIDSVLNHCLKLLCKLRLRKYNLEILKSVQRAESNLFETKSKVEINEMYSNCYDSYRQVIRGSMQCQQ